MKRTHQQLTEALGKQLKFLHNSCAAFDQGDEDEALRIALTVRILVHDTDISTSLLKQLKVKERILFIDSADYTEPRATGEKVDGNPVYEISGMPGLFGISPSSGGMRLIPLESVGRLSPGPVPFDDWWTRPCIPGEQGTWHTRKWLITKMCNEEGGAHIDPKMSFGYHQLQQSNMGYTVQAGGVQGFINSPADVSVRQIGWEILESLSTADLV